MTQNKLEISKKNLAQAFGRLEQLIEQKLQNSKIQSKAAVAETHRLEKHLKTINNRYISLQTVTKYSIEECDKILITLEKLIKK